MANYRRLKKEELVNTACEGGNVIEVGIGDLSVQQKINGMSTTIKLKDVGFAPKLSRELGFSRKGSNSKCRNLI